VRPVAIGPYHASVPSWEEIERAVPELAAAVRARFEAYQHTVLATLRADGSPRLSGIETTFRDGELFLGMMPESRKAVDLRRDPRLEIHSPPVDADLADGDARITGRGVEVTEPGAMAALVRGDERHAEGVPPGHVFRVDVTEVMLLKVGEPPDHLVIESWRDGQGLRRIERH
jgi:pyridoxamine 5'-phosphate oxidase-like protein